MEYKDLDALIAGEKYHREKAARYRKALVKISGLIGRHIDSPISLFNAVCTAKEALDKRFKRPK